ncbi:MAG: 2-polyprenyl-3-methyl-5-hydroxy-6-metoxy-1,4-benzoquinol methylase [Bacteroidia bacterium]|jgi:2-polyprenyl-3-methyl-5-hydroxy-6-metoxy-1,4-benzoquinol methylase
MQIMLANRSHQKELIDAENIPEVDLFKTLDELDRINTLLGGYAISVKAVKEVIERQPGLRKIVDIGCGGGDTLRYLKKELIMIDGLHFVGCDYNSTCIAYAKKKDIENEMEWITDDYKNIFKESADADIIHACLFMHHLGEEEIIQFIKSTISNGKVLIINDLERNYFAYLSIKVLTKLFSRSRLVKNDAPLSVRRGFKKREWKRILMLAGAKNYTLQNRWAFRHKIVVYG